MIQIISASTTLYAQSVGAGNGACDTAAFSEGE